MLKLLSLDGVIIIGFLLSVIIIGSIAAKKASKSIRLALPGRSPSAGRGSRCSPSAWNHDLR